MMRKILIIEDNPSALKFAAYTLEQEGYQVLTAANGIDGLKMAQDEEPDLIVLDVMLPGMDGFELCYRLRNVAATARLPILMLSVKGRESDRNTGLKVGASQYLTKPIGPSELVASVEELLPDRDITPVEKGHHVAEYLSFGLPDERKGGSK